ncbi:AraC family transcriptional regulator of adaptative response / methylphosphotriester-DNA alkyltransferase methyltransferase [Paenibacillus anaericanus]|uniref:bifunctional transcriptional activator/DNA repair enzyme AdaA n=1 Tax=Paenibacillus anaericanus TaxID=170367 RepID=UPI002780269B|nr:Ada metal-binding domain-containing protein [Paenibacillus anaericanus]MDQ0090365.1 AraC family transcriptional regulator of adaptative response / methylphosphotriester-DNA alkyltransferase methyltransferase [Paenibacillus anaericanus]
MALIVINYFITKVHELEKIAKELDISTHCRYLAILCRTTTTEIKITLYYGYEVKDMDQKLFDLLYAAVVNRESTYEGVYYTGVKTTKIVCRPTCRAKTPKAMNVTFYSTLEDALQAGFRPCKRCKPEANGALGPDAALAAQVDTIIETQYKDKLTLSQLAALLAISPYHLQRTYKRVSGYSPAEKTELVRLKHAQRFLLESNATIAEIGEAVGYGSPSHFAAWFSNRTGISPTAYRNGQGGGDESDE